MRMGMRMYLFLGIIGLLVGLLMVVFSIIYRRKLASWLFIFLILLGIVLFAGSGVWIGCVGFFLS